MLWGLQHGSCSNGSHSLIKKMTHLPGDCWKIMRQYECHCEWDSGEVWELTDGRGPEGLA